MWVRNQDKKGLLNCIEFRLGEYASKTRVYAGTAADNNSRSNIGIYSSEEEALKVLDQLHFWLNMGEPKVFQMPEEGFRLP
jgi:hypothetical protein